jgi:hypothetical protein
LVDSLVMDAASGSTPGRSLAVPESAWPDAGVFLLVFVLLVLEAYDFSAWGWHGVAIAGLLVLTLLNGYWFARSFGKRILHDEAGQMVAEKVFWGQHFARVRVPKTEIEKVVVQVILRRGNKTDVRIKFHRLRTKPDLTIKGSLKGQAAAEFVEQVRRFVDGWSTLETRTIDATQ